jgi:hypothetical protein
MRTEAIATHTSFNQSKRIARICNVISGCMEKYPPDIHSVSHTKPELFLCACVRACVRVCSCAYLEQGDTGAPLDSMLGERQTSRRFRWAVTEPSGGCCPGAETVDCEEEREREGQRDARWYG